jgi:hypothetical protein
MTVAEKLEKGLLSGGGLVIRFVDGSRVTTCGAYPRAFPRHKTHHAKTYWPNLAWILPGYLC